MVLAITGHADVTTITPLFAPRVLDEPVVFAHLGAVADDEDAVIEIAAAALGLVVDAL